MVRDYIAEHYVEGEPIFIEDIHINEMKKNAIRQQIHNLYRNGSLKRYAQGIYYLGDSLFFEDVLQAKYIRRNGKVFGYISGLTLANQLGMTSQVPNVIEVTSNVATNRSRNMNLNGFRFVLKQPKTTITEENEGVLKVLDMVSHIQEYADSAEEGANGLEILIQRYQVSSDQIRAHLKYYPARTSKRAIEGGLA